MMYYNVSNRGELIAAIAAAAQPTFSEAAKNPIHIQLGGTQYSFKEGLHVQRASQIIHRIRRTSAAAFNVKDTLC
jgi:CO/xanthine dehydrogenase Mo-binding subunit